MTVDLDRLQTVRRGGQTASRPVVWWWGTNRPGGAYYAGRVHVVAPGGPATGLCGLPVADVWELRPPAPEHVCPDCCVRAMAASHPPFPTTPPPRLPAGQHGLADDDWFAHPRRNPVEETVVLPAIRCSDGNDRAVAISEVLGSRLPD